MISKRACVVPSRFQTPNCIHAARHSSTAAVQARSQKGCATSYDILADAGQRPSCQRVCRPSDKEGLIAQGHAQRQTHPCQTSRIVSVPCVDIVFSSFVFSFKSNTPSKGFVSKPLLFQHNTVLILQKNQNANLSFSGAPGRRSLSGLSGSDFFFWNVQPQSLPKEYVSCVCVV